MHFLIAARDRVNKTYKVAVLAPAEWADTPQPAHVQLEVRLSMHRPQLF
jgi:hypothetical protein